MTPSEATPMPEAGSNREDLPNLADCPLIEQVDAHSMNKCPDFELAY
jgi:hypothetical protein